jgi:type IV pilus biogenesis protein CpaD/CtpE
MPPGDPADEMADQIASALEEMGVDLESIVVTKHEIHVSSRAMRIEPVAYICGKIEIHDSEPERTNQ